MRALRTAPNSQFALARQIGAALGMPVHYVGQNGAFDGMAHKGVAFLSEGMRNPELATKAISALRCSRFDVSRLVTDVAAVRAIMVDTWAQHGANEDRAHGTKSAAAAAINWASADKHVPAAQQLSEATLTDLSDTLLAGVHNAPPVFVLDSPELLASHGIRVDDAPVASGAMFDGKIFLFRDGIDSPAQARATIWHELFHYGLRKLLTPERYAGAMTRLYNRAPQGLALRRPLDRQWGLRPTPPAQRQRHQHAPNLDRRGAGQHRRGSQQR